MRPVFSHPLWTHIPAIAALSVLIVALVSAMPLPADAPVHYGPSGQPDRYGSPGAAFALIIGLSVGFIALSVWLDELWARQERRKTFNYFALLDEIVVGAMAGQGLGYLRLVEQAASSYVTPTQETVWFLVPAIAGALVLERLRPFVSREMHLHAEDTTGFRRELHRRVQSGMPFVYSDIQNPGYVNLISILLPAVLFISAALQAATQPIWSTMLLLCVGILLASFYGGLRTSITSEHILIRIGTPGYRALRLAPSEVAEVALYSYMPLKEFGGYGIRANRQMRAYYLSGGTGVLLTTREGKKHLIGSDHPERLADVIRAVAGTPA